MKLYLRGRRSQESFSKFVHFNLVGYDVHLRSQKKKKKRKKEERERRNRRGKREDANCKREIVGDRLEG